MTPDWLLGLFIVLAVTAGYALEVQLPWRGRAPLGHAAVIALAVLLEPVAFTAAIAFGLALVAPIFVRRHGVDALRRVTHLGLAAAAAAGANAVVNAAAGAFADLPVEPDVETFIEVVLAGAAYLAVDFRLASRRPAAPALREVLPLHVVFVCAAALLAIAHEHYGGFVAPVIAAAPLVVIRFSFERYARARETYEQTSQALGLLPEVAGMTPLGHGTRSAVYAERLATSMALEPPEVARVAAAARLHHIADVSLDDPEVRHGPVDSAELAVLSEDILRETGFLDDVAPLVAMVRRVDAAATDRPVAIVRVASTLDDLAGDDATADGRIDAIVVEVLARHSDAVEREAAIALISLLHHRPGLLAEARAASAAMALVASDRDHAH